MIFVTGASGLVGSHLIAALLAKGKSVRALYRNKIPPIQYGEQVEWVPGDLLDMDSLEKALEGIHQVYHCAAIVSFAPNDAQRMMKANVEGTANLVNACIGAAIHKLVFVSSVAALGRIRTGVLVDESMHWSAATSNSIYGQSKYLAELEVWRGMAEGLSIAIVNPVIILGAGDWDKGSSGVFKSAYHSFPWYTTGESGFVDVLDVIAAMQLLMDSPIEGQRFVISAENLPYRTIFNQIAAAFQKRKPHRKVTPFLAGLVWRMEAIKALFTGKQPLLTKETAATAQAVVHFNNQKFLTAFPTFQYQPISQSIQRISKELKEKYQLD